MIANRGIVIAVLAGLKLRSIREAKIVYFRNIHQTMRFHALNGGVK